MTILHSSPKKMQQSLLPIGREPAEEFTDKQMDANHSKIPLINGFACTTQVVCSPLVVTMMRHIGCKATFITGVLLVSGWNIVFGFLPWIDNQTIFIISCMVCRVVIGFWVNAMQNAIFVIIAMTWPQDIAFR